MTERDALVKELSALEKQIAGYPPASWGGKYQYVVDLYGWALHAKMIAKKALAISTPASDRGGEREDAERWRALMACPRIRLYGCAGLDPKTGEKNEYPGVHFGADFWSYGEVEGEQSGPEVTQWGKNCLIALADDIRKAKPSIPAPVDERVVICRDGREFVMELAMVMGVVDVTADPSEAIPVAELMSKMMERAKEDRERWHTTPTPEPIPVRDQINANADWIDERVRILKQWLGDNPEVKMLVVARSEVRSEIAKLSLFAAALRRTVPARSDDVGKIIQEIRGAKERYVNPAAPRTGLQTQQAYDYMVSLLIGRMDTILDAASIAPAPLREDEMREILAEEIDRETPGDIDVVNMRAGKDMGISITVALAAMRRLTARNG